MEFRIKEGYLVDVKKENKDFNGKSTEVVTVMVREASFDEVKQIASQQYYFLRPSKEIPFSELEKLKEKKVEVLGTIRTKRDTENNKTYTNYYIESIDSIN